MNNLKLFSKAHESSPVTARGETSIPIEISSCNRVPGEAKVVITRKLPFIIYQGLPHLALRHLRSFAHASRDTVVSHLEIT